MNKNSTINSFILYLYSELSPRESIQWMERIMRDEELAEEFEALGEVKSFIDNGAILSPEKSTVESILEEITH